ncbi:hypothetical protein EYS14_14590 [Alteromonadaceae bacterium M269]|nr:hypothetical protein EYS14_14590 [Alteromonadaceae bacterium M269]
MRAFINKRPFLLAGILFYLAGFISIVSAVLNGNTTSIASGAMFIAVGSLYVLLDKRKKKTKCQS